MKYASKRRVERARLPMAVLSLACTWVGCAPQVGEHKPEGSMLPENTPSEQTREWGVAVDPVREGVVDADWLGFELGVPAPEVQWVGIADFADSSEGQTRPPPAATGETVPFVHLPETEVDVVDFETGKQYRVSISDEVDEVVKERARMAEEGGPELGELESSDANDLIQKRIIGSDTRVSLGTAAGQPEDGWLAAIGLLDPNACTGTLISRTAYITAAHCIYSKTGKVIKRDFFPRADAGFNLPWGVWTATSASAPGAWAQNKCFQETKAECAQYDIALVKVTPDPLHPGHKWFFATAAETRPTLLTREIKNRGYPLCSAVDPPVGCSAGDSMTLFGDRANCTLGDDVYPSDPYSPVIYHGCDTSEGHSGSPMFYYRASGSPVIIGTHVGSYQVGGVWKNGFKRFSSNTLRWFNGLL